ncbi:hypothetical protein RDABS01_027966 [Bienertia sinuspersici]
MMLWFRIPGLGFSSGGLRCLLDEASFDQLKGYAYNEGIVNIYASHKVDTPEFVNLNELTGVRGKKPVATTTPTPTLVNASAANDGKDVDVSLQDDGNNVSSEDEDDDSTEDENYKGIVPQKKTKKKVNEKQAKEKCDATLEEEDNMSVDDAVNEEYHYNSEDSVQRRAQLASRWAETESGSTHTVQQAQPNDRNNEEERQQSYTQDLVRDSDDEDPFSEEDDEESNIEVQKRRKRVKYPMFNENTDMKHVELVVGLRFTSKTVFKQAIVAYSIQQHKDLMYLKNDKKIH